MKHPLAEYMETYTACFLAYLRDRNFSENTIDRYTRILEAFVNYLGEQTETRISDPKVVNKGAILAFLRQPGASGSTPSSVVWNSRLACLRSFFGYLYREELVPENHTVKVEFSRLAQKQPVYLTHQEYQQLQFVIDKNAHPFYKERDKAIVTTFFHTGLRLFELVSLDIDQIDWPGEIFRRVKRKGGSVKNVFFNGEVTVALGDWVNKRSSLGASDTERALFLSDRRKRIQPRSVERLFSHYSELVGLGKKITPHVLRHTTATELLRRGEDIRIVSEVLNHANLNTTKHYAHLMEGAEKKAIDRLAER